MKKRFLITVIALIVAALHFFKGRVFQGQFHVFVNGYMIDILLPMTLFLLMGLFQNKTIHSCPGCGSASSDCRSRIQVG